MSTVNQQKNLRGLFGLPRPDSDAKRFNSGLLWLLVVALFLLVSYKVTSLGHWANELAVGAWNSFGVESAPQTSNIPTYKLDVLEGTLNQMQTALENGDSKLGHDDGGNKPYFKASLSLDNQEIQRAKICLRGSMPWHHDFAKPSLRIKIKKADHRGGARYVELTRPEDSLALKNWLPSQMAKEMGLISEGAEHVRLFINNEFFGVYLKTMRQGEPMALSHNRMPGTFFKGDFADLWTSVDSWKTAGEESEEDKQIFDEFLTLLREQPTRENLESLKKYLDFEQYARWSALMTVTGSLHTDHMHNHSYFYSGVRGLIEPIPWDCNSFGIHAQVDSPVDAVQHPILLALTCDPSWVHRRNEIIFDLMRNQFSLEKLTRLINDETNLMLADLKADTNLHNIVYTKAGWKTQSVSVLGLENEKDQLIKWIKERYAFLENYLDSTQVAVSQTEDRITAHISGNVAVRLIPNPQSNGSNEVLFPGLSKKVSKHFSSPGGGGSFTIPIVSAVPLSYEFSGDIDDLTFVNAITGKQVKPAKSPEDLSTINTETASRSLHPSTATTEPSETVRLGPGDVTLEADLYVGPKQKLLVQPGTTVLLGPGVGVYCKGKIVCAGTESKPIEFAPQEAGQAPWSAIAVFGQHSSGSSFEFTSFQGGSIGRYDNHRFKGMVNAYHCPSIQFSNCRFEENHIGDDTLNIAQSNFEIESCVWNNSRADAFDSDMSTGTIQDCEWINSGNDGLDMMTSKIVIQDCRFVGSADKGISVGERSNLGAVNVAIRDCMIGVQIKDDSIANFKISRFSGNATGAHAYQKKWFYPKAGSATFSACVFESNRIADIVAKKKSHFHLVDSPIETFDGKTERFSGIEMNAATQVDSKEQVEKL